MNKTFLIGLDYGSESARGVLVDVASGVIVDSQTYAYRHAVMSETLPGGQALPPGWALQFAPDYTEAAAVILERLGRGREVAGIGIGFTASSPLPCAADGTPLSAMYPDERHAYVKLWKHQSAQPWADRINAAGGDFLANCGGKLSGEWLLAKAAQIADEAPHIWDASERFIEAGDWLVWQLCGQEARSESFACYKAQYRKGVGYPEQALPGLAGLAERLREPLPIGSAAGELTAEWREKTGILGPATVAVAIIDSHVAMPALGVVEGGALMGALGTSAAFLLLDATARPLAKGIEGMAFGAAIPGLWCHEAGQASFGDLLAWFVRAFPHAGTTEAAFKSYNTAAANMRPGENHLLALDWWNGCRVPFGDSTLNGLLLGFNMRSTALDVYRALLESLCYGARTIVDLLASQGAPIERLVLTGGLSQKNVLLMQMLADVLGRELSVPLMPEPTATGAAIHAAVAAGVVADFTEGARRFGAREFITYRPDAGLVPAYETVYQRYRALSANAALRELMQSFG